MTALASPLFRILPTLVTGQLSYQIRDNSRMCSIMKQAEFKPHTSKLLIGFVIQTGFEPKLVRIKKSKRHEIDENITPLKPRIKVKIPPLDCQISKQIDLNMIGVKNPKYKDRLPMKTY